MIKTTELSDLPQKDDDDEVVGGGGDKNLSKSKKSKMQSPEFRHVPMLQRNLHS